LSKTQGLDLNLYFIWVSLLRYLEMQLLSSICSCIRSVRLFGFWLRTALKTLCCIFESCLDWTNPRFFICFLLQMLSNGCQSFKIKIPVVIWWLGQLNWVCITKGWTLFLLRDTIGYYKESYFISYNIFYIFCPKVLLFC
jgi:hypothetical protein